MLAGEAGNWPSSASTETECTEFISTGAAIISTGAAIISTGETTASTGAAIAGTWGSKSAGKKSGDVCNDRPHVTVTRCHCTADAEKHDDTMLKI